MDNSHQTIDALCEATKGRKGSIPPHCLENNSTNVTDQNHIDVLHLRSATKLSFSKFFVLKNVYFLCACVTLPFLCLLKFHLEL